MDQAIRHEAEARRFVIDVEGGPAYVSYREVGGLLDLNSTFVPQTLRGAGLASRLTAHALDYARQRGYRVVPSCPFVAAYIGRHPEYRDLVA